MHKLIAFILLLVASLISILITHQQTKKSYYAVGKNDGAIEANLGTMKQLITIQQSIPNCKSEDIKKENLIVAVKSKSIHANASGDFAISLCAAP